MKPLRFAVIGTRLWSNYQIPAWKELEGVELVAPCKRTRKPAEEVTAKFGVQKLYDPAGLHIENALKKRHVFLIIR